jgi:S1-C subfamily serine protease
LLVVGVEDGSEAANAGIQPGDIIERVGQSPVTTTEELQAAVSSILNRQTGDDKTVALYVNRKGERSFVIVNVSK